MELVTYDSGAKERFECSIDNHIKPCILATYIVAAINKTRSQERRQKKENNSI